MKSMMPKHATIFLIALFSLVLFSFNLFGSNFKKIEKTFAIRGNAPLSIYIDADAGEISVCKNDSSDEIAIRADVNDEVDELEMGMDERQNEFSISLERKKWLKSMDNEGSSELEIRLPVSVILQLTGAIKAGRIEFDLGGLKLKNLELRNMAGEAIVDFPEPNPIEMESLDINVSVGETTLRRLGNARFHDANINGGIGDLHIDLTGEILTKSEADIDLDIGATTVYLPTDSGIRLKSSTWGFLTETNLDTEFHKKGRYYFSKNYDTAGRIMYISISSGVGELKVKFR
ncbi:MAG: LiaF domain-containing protein [Candidatus Zhuqueibacterota bacterium]